MRPQLGSHGLIIWKYDTYQSNSDEHRKQKYWTMKCRSQWSTFILRSNVGSYRLIILKYDVHTSNCLQGIRQNQWTLTTVTYIYFEVKFGLYQLIIPKYDDVHTSNSLQTIRQNQWIMKYRPQWPTFILWSNARSYWLIIQKYDVHARYKVKSVDHET